MEANEMYFKDLLHYRKAWMGIALLLIMVFHLPIGLGLMDFLKAVSYGGVDICFFASGVGCYYSLTKDSDVGNFMKRRLKRMMPAYMIVTVGWLAFQYISGNFGIRMALGNLLLLQHFSGHPNVFNWYFSAALLFYFLAPYFKIVVDRTSSVYKYLFLLFLFVCSIPFWRSDAYIITVTRLPVFYAGMLFADLCQQSKRICANHIICAILTFLAGAVSLAASYRWLPQYLWPYGLYWYPFLLITPPLCMAISCFMMLTEKINVLKPIGSFLSLCGDYSLELAVIHVFLFSLISYCIERFGLFAYRYFIWIAGVISLIAGCYILRRLTLQCNRLFK